MARAATVLSISSVLIVLASFAGQTPNLEKALEAQRQLIEQQPYDSQTRNDLGNLLLVAGHVAEAEEAYRRAVELDTRNTSARFNLAVLLQQGGRSEEAQREIEGLLEVDAYHGWAHYQLGVMLDQQGNRSKALEHYARAFAYDPSLTFAENNPHIIDNSMSTEALLLSQKYRRPQASAVPRLYSNPDRIVDLMLEDEDKDDEGDEAEAADAEEGSRSGDAAASPRGADSRLPSGSSGGDESARGDSISDRASARDETSRFEEDEEDEAPQRRVLTPASVGSGSRNQAARAPSARSSSRSSSSGGGSGGNREALRQAFEERFKAARERAQSQPSAESNPTDRTGAGRRPRYIPGRNSTGRLHLEIERLGPTAPAERHASVDGSATAS